MKKSPGEIPGLVISVEGVASSPYRPCHPQACRGLSVLLRPFGDHGFRSDQKPGDRSCILQGRPNNLGRVNDALGDKVPVFAVLGVEAEVVLILFKDLTDDDRAVFARIDRDLASRPGERLAHDVDAVLLIVVLRASRA